MMKRPWTGFSLIELLIVVGVLGIVTGALALLFTSGHRSTLSSEAYVHVQQEARRALGAMNTELHKANNIDTELTSPGGDTPSGGATRLNFQISRGYNVSGCTPNATCWGNDTTNGGWVHALRNGTQLVRCESAASDTTITDFSPCRVLANYAETFLVDYASSTRTVTLRLQVKRSSSLLPTGAMDTGTLRTQARLRNPS
ncbi:MAG: type II secretion system protein [Candidatus Omnitrophica bacterium]|nr:type II secretion system protein [Candidatus Omnitrophota bacterium]